MCNLQSFQVIALHDLYVFDFLRTVSQQLKETLETLSETALNDVALAKIQQFQIEARSMQGVYVLIYEGTPRYIGKANNVKDRLSQHLTKLRGRRNINISDIGYKVLLLDKSMSTAANESILINLFKEQYSGMWNGAGFGPKDPGKERDTTKPGKFDQQYPIIEDYPVNINVDDEGLVGLSQLLSSMKNQLPYVFRYEVDENTLATKINLANVQLVAKDLLQTVVTHLGIGWRGAVISYGMVLYKTNKNYPHGSEINPGQP